MSINTIISNLTTVCRTLQNLLLHFGLHSYALAILCLGLDSSHQVAQDLYFYVAEIQYDYRKLLSNEWFSQNSSGFHLHVDKYWFKWVSVTTAAIKRPKRNLEMVKEVFFLLLPEMEGWGVFRSMVASGISCQNWRKIEREKNFNRTAKQAKSTQKAIRGKHVTRGKGQIVWNVWI